MNSISNKGIRMEEALRAYFIKSGYYTLRGVPFSYRGFDVTDVDIWLYDRSSPVSRQRILVDIKNKKTPQAIERIFWAKGLQEMLNLDQAIVATTDRRPDVADFGREHGVVVLDGNFLSRLMQGSNFVDGRISEEELAGLIDTYTLNKVSGDWKLRLRRSKQMVLTDLHYNQINYWLGEAKFFAGQVLLVPTHRSVAARLLYLIVSLIAIAIDFVMRDLAFSDQKAKYEHISNGLQYGSSGAKGTKHIINVAIGLVEQYAPEAGGMSSRIRHRLEQDLENNLTRIPSEYFSRGSTAQHLYPVALELEAFAYARRFRAPGDLSLESRSLLAVLLDYWGMDRVRFNESLKSEEQENLPHIETNAAAASDTELQLQSDPE